MYSNFNQFVWHLFHYRTDILQYNTCVHKSLVVHLFMLMIWVRLCVGSASSIMSARRAGVPVVSFHISQPQFAEATSCFFGPEKNSFQTLKREAEMMDIVIIVGIRIRKAKKPMNIYDHLYRPIWSIFFSGNVLQPIQHQEKKGAKFLWEHHPSRGLYYFMALAVEKRRSLWC